jgi:hypothetical protein
MTARESDRALWRRLLVNRFTITLAAIATVTVLWNVYVSTHNHGIVAGRVIDGAGHPVNGATVVLWVLNFTTFSESARTVTGADGRFSLHNPSSHHIQIGAEKPGFGHSPRLPVRLWFRAQDVELAAPLVLAAER